MLDINKINNHITVNDPFDSELYIAEKYSAIANTFVNTNNLDSEDFFELVFDSIFRLIPEAQKGSFYKLEDQLFRPIFSRGYDKDILKKITYTPDEAFIDFDSSESQIIDAYEVYINKRDESKFKKETLELYKLLGTYENFASLYAPIKYEDKKIGLICFDNFDLPFFSKNSKLLLKIYAQLISNYYTLKMHQKKERDKYKGIINALVNAIEVKDKYTVGHARRVADYSEQIAIVLKLPKEAQDMIKTAAILHDVGKIGIPDGILNKPTRLTAEEYEIVKMHSADTRKILETIDELDEVVNYAYMHHEHFDGSGYPQGLSDKEIPIEAQIIQCADAYDAMISDRAYRKAMSQKEVKSILLSEKGKQFNPSIVDVIIELFLKSV